MATSDENTRVDRASLEAIDHLAGYIAERLGTGFWLMVVISVYASIFNTEAEYFQVYASYFLSQHYVVYRLVGEIWTWWTRDDPVPLEELPYTICYGLSTTSYLGTYLASQCTSLIYSYTVKFLRGGAQRSHYALVTALALPIYIWFRLIQDPWGQLLRVWRRYREIDETVFNYSRRIMLGPVWFTVDLIAPRIPAIRSKFWSSVSTFHRIRRMGQTHIFGQLRTQKASSRAPPESYSYPKLENPKSFRILKLWPRIVSEELKCDLIEAQIDQSRKYEAISYTWGDGKPCRPILNGSSSFIVTQKVFDILSERRSDWCPKYLWIDAICINQQDAEDKTRQVQMMREIFAKASRVTVWLGPGPDANLIWNLLMQKFLPLMFMDSETRSKSLSQAYFEDRQREGQEPKHWLALLKMLQNPWFDRVWVIQEVAVGNKVLILYGDRCFPWEHVSFLFRNLAEGDTISSISTTELVRFGPDDRKATGFPAGAVHGNLMNDFRIDIKSDKPVELFRALCICNTFKATDLRDKVFALLGLTAAWTSRELVVDYQLSTSQVLINTARYLYKTDNFIPQLLLAGLGWPRTAAETPSWVMDWTGRRYGKALGISNTREQHLFYHASGNNSVPHIALEQSRNVMHVDGFPVATVHTMTDSLLPKKGNHYNLYIGESLPGLQGWLRVSTQMIAQLPEIYHNGTPRMEAFWRTLIGNCDFTTGTYPAPDEFGESFDVLLWAMVELQTHVDPNPETELGSKIQTLAANQRDAAMGFMEDQKLVIKLISGVSLRRRFALTDDGYMAVVPPGSEPGDMVCIVHGIGIPILLRPLPEHGVDAYAWVGECYVHGMMDGEMMDAGHEVKSLEIH